MLPFKVPPAVILTWKLLRNVTPFEFIAAI
jgi:hypothetical protein